MRRIANNLGAALACLCVGFGSGAAAQESSTFVDLDASVGYSSNPFLSSDEDVDSAYVRASARVVHSWSNVRNSGRLAALVENTSYFNEYDQKLIFDLTGEMEFLPSERVSLVGQIGFSGDFNGQLGSRFQPISMEQQTSDEAPAPVDLTDLDLLSVSGRQYRLNGRVAATIRASERNTIDLSFGAEKFFIDDLAGGDYANFSGSVGFRRQASERVSFGLRFATQYTDYPNSGHAISLRPAATATVRLSESWELTAAAGASHVIRELMMQSSTSTNPFVEGRVCWTRESVRLRLCANAAHSSQNTALLDLVTTTTVGASYSQQLDSKQSLQVSANFVHYSRLEGSAGIGESDYFTANGSYDRKFSDQFSAGLNLGVRKLAEMTGARGTDFSALVYLRFRLGDTQ